jgi:hypothetical protein
VATRNPSEQAENRADETFNTLSEGGSLTVRLDGPAVRGHRIAIRDLTAFAESLQVAVERVAQVLSGSASTLQGGIPSSIKKACALDILGVGKGSVEVMIAFSPLAQNPLIGTAGNDALQTLISGCV